MAINTSTVVLLVILGFLIYAFTRNAECFADVAPGMATAPASYVDSIDTTQNAESQRLMSEMLKQLGQSELLQSNKQQTVGATSEDVARNPFNYEPNDDSGIETALLENAFELPVPKVNEAIKDTVVNTQKNNVDKYDARDFLPKEDNPEWFDDDFSQAKYNLNNDKLINTDRYVIGINTVGQSLKNASYDIRGTIPNPKFTVSPWNNSTYEPDYNIKPMC
jgi:hypothetical protein